MREFPYPASEDPELAAAFGADVLRGLTVLCIGGGETELGQWSVSIASSEDGLQALETVRRSDGRVGSSSMTLSSQDDWADVFERAAVASLMSGHEFSVDAWMDAQIAMSQLAPFWDTIAADAAWDDVVGKVNEKADEMRAEAARLESLIDSGAVKDLVRELMKDAAADPRTREIRRAMKDFPGMEPSGRRPN